MTAHQDILNWNRVAVVLWCATVLTTALHAAPDAPRPEAPAAGVKSADGAKDGAAATVDPDKAGAGRPTANVGKKPGKAETPAVLTAAVEALTTEYREAQKTGAVPARTKSDYFSTNRPDVTAEQLLAAVARPVASDPGCDAYVRWQLLSAVPDSFEGPLAGKAVAVYRSAPHPLTRPGATPDERKELDRMIRSQNLDVDALNAQFTKAVDRRIAPNGPIYGFRDGMFAKLPATPDTFVAALSDAADRFRAADPDAGGAQLREVEGRVTLWTVTLTNPRLKVPVIETVERLRKEPGVEYAVTVVGDRGQRRWQTRLSRPGAAALNRILEALKGS